jgi:hypothetical protein
MATHLTAVHENHRAVVGPFGMKKNTPSFPLLRDSHIPPIPTVPFVTPEIRQRLVPAGRDDQAHPTLAVKLGECPPVLKLLVFLRAGIFRVEVRVEKGVAFVETLESRTEIPRAMQADSLVNSGSGKVRGFSDGRDGIMGGKRDTEEDRDSGVDEVLY